MLKVAIDGPAGAGKSTVARKVAEHLGFLYIDTGAMYRALTYAALREKVNLEDGELLTKLLNRLDIQLTSRDSGSYVYLNGVDITEDIRRADVTGEVSKVANHESVRIEMVKRQRQLAKEGRAVLDGRDIGTYVLPDAEVKFFLTASVDERAKRRYEEQLSKGLASNLKQIKEDIILRDHLDSTRDFAPLKKAKGAIEVDTTTLNIDEVVKLMIDIIQERQM